jgi:hypothetical protein
MHFWRENGVSLTPSRQAPRHLTLQEGGGRDPLTIVTDPSLVGGHHHYSHETRALHHQRPQNKVSVGTRLLGVLHDTEDPEMST